MAETRLHESAEFPSLIDDDAFLAELEKLEGDSVAAVTRPVHPRFPGASGEPVIPRDVNRWILHPPPGVDPEPIVQQRPSWVTAVVVILIGLCTGAAGSAAVFYDRLVEVIASFLR